MAELNRYVPVSVLEQEPSEATLGDVTVVVLTETVLEKQLKLNEITHKNGIRFIVADTRGLFGMAFCDFGEEFYVNDTNGEQPLTGIIASISKVTSDIYKCRIRRVLSPVLTSKGMV